MAEGIQDRFVAPVRYLPGQPGYNRRLRAAAALITTLIRLLAADTSLWADDVWVADSTPVECGRSQETAHRSDLAGWAEYGYCASHSRYFWGLRLHLVATLGGLRVAFALTGAKAGERQTQLAILADPHPGRRQARTDLHRRPAVLRQPVRGHPRRLAAATPGPQGRARAGRSPPVQALRQTIESINQTFKGQLDLERHSGHTPAGVMAWALPRILALTAAIWHNDHTAAPVHRSLTAYDH